MNQTIQNMLEHVSVRAFEPKTLSPEIKQTLVSAAQSGSTSNFVQAYSILEITDPKLREQLADITNSAPYVKQTGTFYVFVADLYRHAELLRQHGEDLAGVSNTEALLVAVVDATIAAQNMALAAESLDLGICYIGGIRNDIEKIAELLELPDHTLPLFGMTIGYPIVKNETKPRLPQANVVAENTYPKASFSDLSAYDAQLETYYGARSSNAQKADFSSKMVEFFGVTRRKEIAAFLVKQGFDLKQ